MTQWPDMPVPDLWAYAAWFWIVLFVTAFFIFIGTLVHWTIRIRRAYRNLPKTVAELRAQQQRDAEWTLRFMSTRRAIEDNLYRDLHHRHFGLGLNDDDDHHDPWPKEA